MAFSTRLPGSALTFIGREYSPDASAVTVAKTSPSLFVAVTVLLDKGASVAIPAIVICCSFVIVTDELTVLSPSVTKR